MKKKERSFSLSALLLALFLCLCITLYQQAQNYGSIRITIGDTEFGTFTLNEDQVIDIGTGNICEIINGIAKMISADCTDQLCIAQPAITRAGDIITCPSHQVVIKHIGTPASSQIS